MPDVYNFIFYTFLTGMTPEARVTSRPATGRTRMCWEAGRSSAETRDDGIKLWWFHIKWKVQQQWLLTKTLYISIRQRIVAPSLGKLFREITPHSAACFLSAMSPPCRKTICLFPSCFLSPKPSTTDHPRARPASSWTTCAPGTPEATGAGSTSTAPPPPSPISYSTS